MHWFTDENGILEHHVLFNSDPVTVCPVRAICFSPWQNDVYEYGASCRPMSPGGGKPISTSSATQLSPHLPSYVLTKFPFSSLNYCVSYNHYSRDNSVRRATGWAAWVRSPVVAKDCSLLRQVQTGSQAHTSSYPTGIGGSFHRDKAAGAWSRPFTTSVQVKNGGTIHVPGTHTRLHGVVLN
jgi:hypothetical protein